MQACSLQCAACSVQCAVCSTISLLSLLSFSFTSLLAVSSALDSYLDSYLDSQRDHRLSVPLPTNIQVLRAIQRVGIDMRCEGASYLISKLGWDGSSPKTALIQEAHQDFNEVRIKNMTKKTGVQYASMTLLLALDAGASVVIYHPDPKCRCTTPPVRIYLPNPGADISHPSIINMYPG